MRIHEGPSASGARVDWIDVAKGISILLVVTMHSTLGVGNELGQTGFMHAVVAYTKPFRMPDFFFLSGLLAAGTLNRDWRWFLDRKVLHFAYFYALWLAILLTARASIAGDFGAGNLIREFLFAFIEPFGTLWFIFVLPAFFLALRLTRDLPAPLVLGVAAMLHVAAAARPGADPYAMASALTGWFAIDSFCLFLVFFLLGARHAELWMRSLELASRTPFRLLAALSLWLALHTLGLRFGLTDVPGLTLVFGLAGALGVALLSILLLRIGLAGGLAWMGRQSLTIYVMFLIPMAFSRKILITELGWTDPGWIAVTVVAVAIVTCLLSAFIAPRFGLGFLFRRPGWARLPAP